MDDEQNLFEQIESTLPDDEKLEADLAPFDVDDDLINRHNELKEKLQQVFLAYQALIQARRFLKDG